MSISRRRLLATTALAGLSLALPGCGNTKSPRANGRKKVRLTYSAISVAKERGVFERTLQEQGIDVEWLGPFPNHAPTLQAVATGSADFSFGGSSTPAHQAILSGANLVYVSWSVTAPRTTSIIVLPDSGIKSVKDLVGKTVAMNRAGVAEFLFVAALEKYGIPRDKVTTVYLNPPDAAPAFASGKIDAWAIWSGPLEMAEVSSGAVRIFEEGKELERQVDYGTYLVRREYAEQEPEVIRKVLKAHQTELTWANEHRAEAQEIAFRMAKYPRAVIERIARFSSSSTLNLMDDQGIAELQRGADWLSEHGILSSKIDVSKHSVRL
jgi:sulfonate transport system substrate-binding protein